MSDQDDLNFNFSLIDNVKKLVEGHHGRPYGDSTDKEVFNYKCELINILNYMRYQINEMIGDAEEIEFSDPEKFDKLQELIEQHNKIIQECQSLT